MLSIYESLYTTDCQKLDKIMALKGIKVEQKGVPDSVICYSTAIKPFLKFLNDFRGNSDIENKLNLINQSVEDKVFGVKDEVKVKLPVIQN